MRYIDNTFLNPSGDWEVKAKAATKKLIEGTHTADQLNDVWKALKQDLSKISNRKCWYCETAITRDDNAVDHYRPKGSLKGVCLTECGNGIQDAVINPPHEGYKWDAFSAENFRYSCTHCNEYRKDLDGTAGGKWNYFPLVVEGKRAYMQVDEENEDPAILDPCRVLDWRLLSYDAEGKPFSRFARGSEEDLKVRLSIRLLHLDQNGLNEGRRAQWALVKPLVTDAKHWYLKKLNGKDGANFHFNLSLKKIRQWLTPKSQSAYIGYLVYMLESDSEGELHPWIDQLVRAI